MTKIKQTVGADPLGYYDPTGLDWAPPSLPQGFIDFFAGWGGMLSFGITAQIRDFYDIGSVDKCSRWYTAGEVVGFANGVAIGWVNGTKATARAASGGPYHWQNFSHSLIPNRAMKKSKNPIVRWFNKNGNRANGDYVTPKRHREMDPYVPMPRDEPHPRFSVPRQWINRIPYVPGTIVYSTGSFVMNYECGCNN
jgi:hypothetical protein